MSTTWETVALVAELLSWLTVPLGLFFLVSGYLRRASSTGWHQTPAVLVDLDASAPSARSAVGSSASPTNVSDEDPREALDQVKADTNASVNSPTPGDAAPVAYGPSFENEHHVVVRWLAPDGSLQESDIDRRALPHTDHDRLTVYVNPHHPGTAHVRHPGQAGHHLVQTGWLLTVTGVLLFALSVFAVTGL